MSVRFLLIPDLHFGAPGDIREDPAPDSDPAAVGRQEAEWLIQALDRQRPSAARPNGTPRIFPEVILATGDLTNGTSDAGFQAARAFFRALKDEFGDASIFVTPGDHDADRFVSARFFHPTIRNAGAFQRFHAALDGIITEPAVVNPDDPCSFLHVLAPPGAPNICVIGLNSVRLDRPTCADHGYVGLDQWSELLLRGLDGPLAPYRSEESSVFGLALTHCHPLPAARSSSVHEGALAQDCRLRTCPANPLADPADLLGALSDAGIAMLVHGHSHKIPSVRSVRGYTLDTQLNIPWGSEGSVKQWPLLVADGGRFHHGARRDVRQFVVLTYEPWEKGGESQVHVRAEAFQYLVGDATRFVPRPLRRESHTSPRMDLKLLGRREAAAAVSYGEALAVRCFRSAQIARACRAWADFYTARNEQGAEWSRQLWEIREHVARDIRFSGRPRPEPSRIEEYCLHIDATAIPPDEQFTSLPRERVADALYAERWKSAGAND